MAQWIDRLATYEARRRTFFKVGGAAGLLLAAGMPSLAFADNGQGNQGDGNGNGDGVGQLRKKFQNIPVSGKAGVDPTNPTGTFQGTFSVAKFVPQGGQVVAMGTLTGTLFDTTGSPLGTVRSDNAAAPLVIPASAGGTAPAAATTQAAAASCQILHLVLGPLTLNLLGLVITIPNPIIIDITAVPGNGNLLGNLLCAIAGLLNPGGNLANLVDALNRLLTALGL